MSDTAEVPRSGSVLVEFDLASLARGTLSLRREWTDVVQEVEAAVESCTWALIGSGHALCVEVPDAPLPAYIDGARLRQVVTNLLDNAGKSTPDTSARSFVVKTNKDLQNVLSVPNDTMIFVESRMDPHDAPPPSPTAATRRRARLRASRPPAPRQPAAPTAYLGDRP